MRASRYRLGLPAWAFPGWQGPYFPPDRPALESYAQVFDTVEGNTTFYQTPGEAIVRNWLSALGGRDFRFCFKLPQTVTHSSRPDSTALSEFFRRMEPLAPSLGPFLLQLPARVGPGELNQLEGLVERLPRAYRYALEVRHRRLFEEPALLEPLIGRFELGRVMLDSRPLYEGDREHPEVLAALHRKPELPLLDTVYHGLAFVRLILHPDIDSNTPYLEYWADRVAAWLGEGHRVYMMIHCPNNQHCPTLARAFHERLRSRGEMRHLPALPPYPVPQQAELL